MTVQESPYAPGEDLADRPSESVQGRDRRSIITLVLASTISNIGNAITGLAIPWFVLETTGSAARTGIAGGLTVMAVVISGMLGGAAVDRLGYKRASVISDLLSGVTVALIPTLYFLDLLEFWHLLALLFLGGIFDAPGSSARSAMIPALARRAQYSLERVNSAMQLANQGSQVLIGPLAAGLLVALVGATGALYVDSLTFVISVMLIGLLLRYPARRAPGLESTSISEPAGSYISDIVAGLRYVAGEPFLRVMIPIAVLYNFLFWPLSVVVLPVFTHDVFGEPDALGIVLTGLGVGTVLSTLAYGAVGTRIPPLPTFWWATGMIAAGFWLLWLSTTLWLAALAMLVVGLALGPINVLNVTIAQRRVPDGMLGRVFGLMGALSSGAGPVGVFLAGFLIEATSFRVAMLVAAVVSTVGLIWVLGSKGLRRALRDTKRLDLDPAP